MDVEAIDIFSSSGSAGLDTAALASSFVSSLRDLDSSATVTVLVDLSLTFSVVLDGVSTSQLTDSVQAAFVASLRSALGLSPGVVVAVVVSAVASGSDVGAGRRLLQQQQGGGGPAVSMTISLRGLGGDTAAVQGYSAAIVAMSELGPSTAAAGGGRRSAAATAPPTPNGAKTTTTAGPALAGGRGVARHLLAAAPAAASPPPTSGSGAAAAAKTFTTVMAGAGAAAAGPLSSDLRSDCLARQCRPMDLASESEEAAMRARLCDNNDAGHQRNTGCAAAAAAAICSGSLPL